MGCGLSQEEKEGKARNEEIENQLKKDRLMQRNEIKMLLLGTSIRPGSRCNRRHLYMGSNLGWTHANEDGGQALVNPASQQFSSR
jgi:hypothetical protein